MVLYDPAQQRWRLHDLMRDLAGGHVATEALGAPADLAARLTAARGRHAEHYCGVLAAARDLYLKGAASRWCWDLRCLIANGATSKPAKPGRRAVARLIRPRRACVSAILT
jgi:hypothetical protein